LLSVSPQERNAYQALFRERQVQKTYQAIAPFRDDLVFPLAHQSRIEEDLQFFLSREVEGVPNSETHVEILKCLDTSLGLSVHPSDDSTEGSTRRSPQILYKPKAIYQLTPITGKRHQLRIHMSALGIPNRWGPVLPRGIAWPRRDRRLQSTFTTDSPKNRIHRSNSRVMKGNLLASKNLIG